MVAVRLWMAIGRPPSLGVDLVEKSIQQKLSEVGSEAMVLLHSRNRDIFVNVGRLLNENGDLLTQINQMHSTVKSLQNQNESLQSELVFLKQQNNEMQQEADGKSLLRSRVKPSKLAS